MIAALAFALALPFVAGALTGLYNAVEARVLGILERRATDRAVDARMAEPLPVEVAPELGYEGTRIGHWPRRQTPSDLAAADEPPWFTPTEYVTRRCVPLHEIARHVSDEYGTGKITYVGKHCWPTEVTAEFERIVRTVVFDEELAEVAS